MANGTKYFTVNENFVKLRKAIGFTQQDFADNLKIKRSLVAAYEEHRAEVSRDVIRDCIKHGHLFTSQVYDFIFQKSYKPTPVKSFKKVMVRNLEPKK